MTDIARLRIDLDDMAPPVRRVVEVPLDIRLSRLHLVIQAAMGWENYHLYSFSVGRHLTVVDQKPDWDPDGEVLLAGRTTLAQLLGHVTTTRKSFRYTYDFGDDWQHTITLARQHEPEPGTIYPHLVAAEGACPPEDCGGPPGYERYVQAIADPAHPDHEEMLAWRGPGFDPAAVDLREISSRLNALSRSWNRTPTARRKA